MPKLEFPNCFIVNKIKQNVAHVSPTNSCVTWWLRYLDASMRSWVQTHVYDAYFVVCVCVYNGVRRA
jgi:hypothetical protein